MTNTMNRIQKTTFAVLMAVFSLVFIRVSVFAENQAITINQATYGDESSAPTSLQVMGNINNDNIAAVLIQVLDAEGKTCVVQAVPVQLGSGLYKYYFANIDVDLANGTYTVYVSDYAGTSASAETTVDVNKASGGEDPDDGNGFQASAYLSIDGSVNLKIQMQIPEQYEAISIDGTRYAIESITSSGISTDTYQLMKDHSGKYLFMKQLPIKCFEDKVTIALYEADETEIIGGDEEPYVFTYSVSDYLHAIEDKYTTNPPAEGTTEYKSWKFCEALETYGHAAQSYFDYKAPADSVQVAEVEDMSEYRYSASGDGLPEGVEYIGSSLILEDKITIRHYFKGDTSNLVAEVSDDFSNDFVSFQTKGNYSYVEFRNILANHLDKAYKVNIYKNNGYGAGDGSSLFKLDNYSAFSYCERVLAANRDQKLVTLVKALVQYNQAAQSYFDN